MSNDDRGVYSPPEDEYDRFDVGDEDDSRRGPLLLMVAIAVVIAFIAVIYTAYNQGVRSGGRDDAPLIQAAAGPIKSKPADPGGIAQPDTSGAAYNAIDPAQKSKEVTLAPPPEQPIGRKITPVETKPVVTSKPQPLAPSRQPSTVFTEGKYLVQIGAYRSKEQALATWDQITKKLPMLFDGTIADIQRADLGSKGIYYRLRAAAYAERSGADKFCKQLQSKGQDCIVVSR